MVTVVVIVFIMFLALAPVVSALVARWFYRRELVDFALGTSGYPILGPTFGAMGFGLSALGCFFALSAEDEETMLSEWAMISFLFSLLGLLALSSLALWRIFGNA